MHLGDTQQTWAAEGSIYHSFGSLCVLDGMAHLRLWLFPRTAGLDRLALAGHC